LKKETERVRVIIVLTVFTWLSFVVAILLGFMVENIGFISIARFSTIPLGVITIIFAYLGLKNDHDNKSFYQTIIILNSIVLGLIILSIFFIGLIFLPGLFT